MASRSLGTLTLDLLVKIGGFVDGFTKGERKVDSFVRNTQRKLSGLGKFIGTALGVSIAGALTGVVAGISNAIDRMDSLRDASIRLGVGVETLSAYSFAAQQLGTDIDALGRGFKFLAKNIAESGEGKGNAKLFEALGISIKDAEGNLRGINDVFLDVADKLSKMEDGTQKAAIMLKLFGKAGLDLTEFVNQGAEGIQKLTDQADRLGYSFGKTAADQADQFNDQLGEMKATFGGLTNQIAIELLPKLIDLAQEFLNFIQDGDKAQWVADNLGGAIKGLGEIAHGVVGIFEALGATVRGVAADLRALDMAGDASQKFLRGDFEGAKESIRQAKELRAEAAKASQEIEDLYRSADPANRRQGAIPRTPIDSMFQVPGAPSRFSAVPTVYPQTRGNASNDEAIRRALGGYTPPKAKKSGSGGKSDAEREAEALAKAINKMTDAQREWQTELDGTGNQIADEYAKRLAEITEKAEDFKAAGIPTEKIAEFRAEMEKLALAIKDKETLEFQKEFALQTQELIAGASGASTATIEYAKSMEELNKQLLAGEINQALFAERAEAYAQVRDSAANSVLANIKEEQALLGATAEYQDTYNKLAYAGVTANSELGQSIIAANEALWEQKEAVGDQIEAMDALRDAGRGIFDDLREGVGIWDAIKNAADDFAATLFKIVANNLVEKALGQQGTSGGGDAGGWFSKLLGSFFGASSGGSGSALSGSFAIGGVAQAGGLYRVNENGPEIASFGGKDYLMVGSQTGVVTPINQAARRQAGGGNTYVYNIPSQSERRVIDAVRAKQSVDERRSAARNN